MSVHRIGLDRAPNPWERVYGGTLLTQQLADAPLGAWPMGETVGSQAFDATGNGINGTYNNCTLNQQTILNVGNNSVAFNGSSSMSLGVPAWTNTDSWTTEVLTLPTSWGTTRWISICDPQAGSERMFQFRILASGQMEVIAWNAARGIYFASSTTTVAAGQPILFAASWNHVSGKLQGYVNGSLFASTTITGTAYPALTTYSFGNSFLGRMSHAAHYGTALPDERLLLHARAAGVA